MLLFLTMRIKRATVGSNCIADLLQTHPKAQSSLYKPQTRQMKCETRLHATIHVKKRNTASCWRLPTSLVWGNNETLFYVGSCLGISLFQAGKAPHVQQSLWCSRRVRLTLELGGSCIILHHLAAQKLSKQVNVPQPASTCHNWLRRGVIEGFPSRSRTSSTIFTKGSVASRGLHATKVFGFQRWDLKIALGSPGLEAVWISKHKFWGEASPPSCTLPSLEGPWYPGKLTTFSLSGTLWRSLSQNAQPAVYAFHIVSQCSSRLRKVKGFDRACPKPKSTEKVVQNCASPSEKQVRNEERQNEQRQ